MNFKDWVAENSIGLSILIWICTVSYYIGMAAYQFGVR